MSRSLTQAEREVPLTELIESAVYDEGTTLRDVSAQDVADIWWRVSQSIATNFVQKKGTRVPELGTFSLNEKKGVSASGKPKITHSPMFSLAATFCARHEIQTRSRYAMGSVPVVSLGLARIAAVTGFDKSVVESCIREVVYALEDRVNEKEGIGLELAGIGRLTIRRQKAKFRFYSDFEQQPKVLFGRPPSSWKLNSRCQTAATLHYGDEDPNRERPKSSARPMSGFQTPLLLPSPSYQDRPRSGKSGSPGKKKITWQSQLGSDGYVSIVDPEDGPVRFIDGGSKGSPATSPTRRRSSNDQSELPPISEEERERIAALAVRNLEPMNSSFPTSSPKNRPKSADTGIEWDRTMGKPLTTLDTSLPPPKRNPGDRLDATTTVRVINKKPRAEARLLDPMRIKPNANPNKYVVFQQSLPTPDNAEYRARVAAQEALEDKYLAELSQKEGLKKLSIETEIQKAKREAASRTASFNWMKHTDRPATAVDKKPRMYLMSDRPSTSHSVLRDRRVAVAADVAMQVNAAKLQRSEQERLKRGIEEDVIAYNRQLMEREAAEKREADEKARRDYQAILDKQAEERARTEHAAHERDNAEWAASKPFQQAVLDEISAARSRARKIQDSQLNIELEAMKINRQLNEEAKEIAHGRAMVDQAKESLIDELKEGAIQTMHSQDILRNEYAFADRAKKQRDAREAQERKAGAALNLLEQVDHIDVQEIPDGGTFLGRATNLSKAFVKGAAVA